MNLHRLHVFTQVAQFGSVTVAAEQLHISQPAVTAQIRKLEQEVGTTLIVGKGRGIELTKDGRYLYEQGRRIFQLEQEVTQNFQAYRQQRQTLRIASSYISTNFILPPVIAQYKQMHPQVELFVALSNVQAVAQRVLNYEVDMGFVVQSEVSNQTLHFEPLQTIPFTFICHPTHPLANKTVPLSDLSTVDFIYRERGSSTRDLVEAVFYTHNCPLPKNGLEIQGVLEAVQIVEAGYGVALTPICSVASALQEGRLARIDVPSVAIAQTLYICIRKGESQHPFIELVKQIHPKK